MTASRSLVATVADRYGVEPAKLLATLSATVFSGANTHELMALLVVADQYHLNPFTREIYAFRNPRGTGIVPVVSVDGWAKLLNQSPDFDGMQFTDGPLVDCEGRQVPEWIECTIHLRGRQHPVTVREWLDECYVPPRGEKKLPGPWQTHTRRMLRHKALVQCARVALGLSGIYDPDEGERIREAEESRVRGKPLVEMPRATDDPPAVIEGEAP